jgi:DNA-directed RNA polymerase specialized sigma24 family protein
MKKDWELTQEAFDKLLRWLDSDRERAGIKYEEIRTRLIKIFTCRGCSDAEELADETINRVASKIDEIAPNYEGDPTPYFFAVSQWVHQEYLRKCRTRQADVSPEDAAHQMESINLSPADDDAEYECLERCMRDLPPANSKLVLEYYRHEKQAKIDHRKRLAEELGIGVNALRIRVHRIRHELEKCLHICLEHTPVH